MTALEFVRHVEELGIDLTLVGDKIRYRCEDGPPPPDLLAEMKQQRAALVSILSRRRALQWPPPCSGRANTDRAGPLSWAQRRVWATTFFLDDGTYNLSGGLRLAGRLDQAAFEAALADVYRRHPSLRTVFTVEDGAATQRILTDATPAIVLRDLSSHPPDAAFDKCLRECEAMTASPLALDQTPPVRTRLYRLAARDHVFFVVLHHVIADGVSLRVLVDDLGQCYSARIGGTVTLPPAHDVDMIDYARFEEEYLQCANLGSTRRYWRNLLRCVELGPLPLPPRLQPLRSDDTGGALAVVVDATTTSGVRRLAAASRSPPFQIVSTAIAFMLSRFTGRDRMVVGMPMARRDRAGLDQLVGLLLDMVPICLDVRGNPTFLELTGRVRTAILTAMSDAVIPVELAIDDQPTSHGGGQMFNVVLTDYGTKRGDPKFCGLDVRPVEVAQVGAKFDLNFLIREDQDSLHIDVEFDRRALSESDVFAMVSMAQRILSRGTADAAGRLLDLAMTPAVAAGAHRAAAAPDQDATLFGRFGAVAKTRADAVALSHEGTAVGYQALYILADRVARGLRRQRCGPGDVVAVALPLGIDLIAAMVGIVGCGASCLVLDEAWPQAHVDHVLSDACVGCIIAAESHPTGSRITVALLAELGSAAEPVPPVPSSAIACLIYTAGSSSRIKGVQVSHRNVLNVLEGSIASFGFDASDTWALVHSAWFESSIWQIFGCLLTGGKLVIVPREVGLGLEAFAQLLRRERVTVLNLTPPELWASMTWLARDASAAESVRYLIFRGEAPRPRLVDRWYREVGCGTRLAVLSGVTEASMHASWRWLEAGAQTVASDVGEQFPGTSLHLLDDGGKPVDDRCVGEIHIGGAGVAAGYLGRPRETALRFVPDPFASTPGSRMFRSGDPGRRNGAAISRLDRGDDQVQLNGYRFELSEVDIALAGQPGIAAAAAAAVGDDGGTFIVAVVVAAADTELSPADPVRGVRSALPGYMVPKSVTVVPALPLTFSGKPDRAAVAAARSINDSGSGEPEAAAPQDSAEALLLELFREVLHDTSVSIVTNFFDRGGDSMRAIRLVSLAGDRGLVVSVRDVYAAPRVRELAARALLRNPAAEAPLGRAPFSLLPTDVAGSFDAAVEDAYPMTALQFGMMYLKERAPGSGVYHIVLSYRLDGRMDPDAFRSAVQAVTDTHPVLRTSFDLGHPSGPVQRVHWSVEPPLVFDDLRHLSASDQAAAVAAVLEQERTTEFDLARPALFRLVVLILSDDEYQLLFTHHHAILDGWSVAVFFEDLHARYLQTLAGEAALIPHLRNVLADYVALEQGAVDEPAHLQFWQAHTSPQSGLLAPDRSGAPVMRQLRIEMRAGMAAELRLIASELEIPIKALLLAAHVRVMAWLTGRGEVVTGQVVNCRPETRDADRVLGLFLNDYPMRIKLGRQTWAELAREVHLMEQAMMPHRWYPHALIQQHHGPTPLFDCYFNFTDFHTTRRLLSKTGLRVQDIHEIESTHYALGINYTLDVRTGELRLILEYDESALPRSTAGLAADSHDRALAAILDDPHSPCLCSPVPGAVDLARRLGHGTTGTVPEPTIGSSRGRTPAASSGPQARLESSVRSVWMKVLGEVDLDVHTSFFDVGGNSLTAMRVISRLRALHGALSMETFMDDPTIAGLARSLTAIPPHAAAASVSVPAVRTGPPPAEGPCQYPLTRAQEHLWQLANLLPGVPLFGMPGALQAEGALDLGILERTLALLLDRHAALRTRISTTDAGPVQVVEPHAELDLETIDLRTSDDPAARCEQLLARALIEPMDLARPPLVRAMVFRIANDLHVIYLNIHHMVCDGWSLALLMREAARIYRDLWLGAGARSGPAEQFGELARAQLEWTSSPEAAAQRRYWIDGLAPPWPSFAGGDADRFGRRERPGILERFRSASCRRLLPLAVAESVSAAVRRRGLTSFMLILAAFASTLRTWSGQNDIRVATMMANRVQPGREAVVGLLANTVVLRLNVVANHDPFELSMQARHVCIEAYERQELPFEDVLASLSARYPAEQRLGRVFEVMLLMQEEFPPIEPHQALRLAPYKPERGALRVPVTPTTCDFVLAATVAGNELALDLQYMPATTEAAVAETLLEDIAVAIGAMARAIEERA